MKVCHIICTGSKHLEITNANILPKDSIYQTREEWDPSRSNSTRPGYAKTRVISINATTYDMIDLAKKCMHEIDNFLEINTCSN